MVYRALILFTTLVMVVCTSNVAAQDQETAEVFNLLFIHHSVGSNWLHPNNGALRDALEDPDQNDYPFEVHDATYGDTIGEDTDVCDWLPKFQSQLALVLSFDYSPDTYYTYPNEYNRIVMFKSCYPASDIDSEGTPPGDPMSTQKTIWNYKAAYQSCAEIFAEHPDVLFIAVSAPPRNRLSYWTKTRGLNACEFNEWLSGDFLDDYRSTTGLNNIAVFDWFTDLLAEPAADRDYPGALKEIYADGSDNHPNQAANIDATALFIPFVNNAVKEWRFFSGDKYTFSIAAPDSVYLHLQSEPDLGGSPYMIMGTVSGVYPGLQIGNGYHLPLNMDAWTQWTLAYGNTPFLPGFQDVLGLGGEAMAAIHSNKPLPPGILGVVMHYSYVVYSPIRFVSSVVPITFVP